MLLASLGSLYFSHQELSNEPKIFKIGEVEPKLCWKWSAHFRDCHKFCGSKKDSKGEVKAKIKISPVVVLANLGLRLLRGRANRPLPGHNGHFDS